MITVVAHSEFKPEAVEAVLAVYARLVEATRKEDGCLRYELYRDRAKSGAFTMIEEWKDPEALQAHLGSAHFKTLVGELKPLAAGPSQLGTYERVL